MGAIPQAVSRTAGMTPPAGVEAPRIGGTRRYSGVSRVDVVVRHLYLIAFVMRAVAGGGGDIATENLEITPLSDAPFYEEGGAEPARAWLCRGAVSVLGTGGGCGRKN